MCKNGFSFNMFYLLYILRNVWCENTNNYYSYEHQFFLPQTHRPLGKVLLIHNICGP